MSNLEYQLFYRRHLPHYQPPGATLFITSRLAGSIPVEVIRRLAEESDMSTIMHSLKRHTARAANQLLDREGDFWQHENYDHSVRDDKERLRIVRYVFNNPVKAGWSTSHKTGNGPTASTGKTRCRTS